MAQRGATARFMPGAWVFPGGVVDESDGGAEAQAVLDGVAGRTDLPWRAAALRELVEETGVWLSSAPVVLAPDERPHGIEVYKRAVATGAPFVAASLVPFSRWITPTVVPIRFDAWFYIATIDRGIEGVADGREMDDVAWVEPNAALRRAAAGTFSLPLPTRKTLQQFASLGSPESIVTFARGLATVPPLQPRIRRGDDGLIEAVLPGEPGFDELPDLPPDPTILAGAVRVTTVDGDPVPELKTS